MDLQVVSSLSALPLVSVPMSKLFAIYAGIKRNVPLAGSVLGVVESSVSKAQTVSAPYLARYQPQIEKVDKLANERVVKRLIDYCGPVVKKTPEELTTDTKQRVTDTVDTVRNRFARTKDRIVSAPAAGYEMITTKYHSAVDMAGEKARKLRTDVPASARDYVDQMWQMASSAAERVRGTASSITQKIPHRPSDLIMPLQARLQPYWDQTSKNVEAAKERMTNSYTWMQERRQAAIATARGLIDNSVGAVWEYTSDLGRELNETWSTGKRTDVLQIFLRRLRTGGDVAFQFVRWSWDEMKHIREAGTSVLDAVLSSWLFNWLTFPPLMNRQPEVEAPKPSAPYVPPTAGEPAEVDFEEYEEESSGESEKED